VNHGLGLSQTVTNLRAKKNLPNAMRCVVRAALPTSCSRINRGSGIRLRASVVCLPDFNARRHFERCDDCGMVRIACLGRPTLCLSPIAYSPCRHPTVAIALQNQEVVSDILLKAAAQTIRVIGVAPQHLGAETGMTAKPGIRS
jgi:hypothetical protein